jgi:hypothetical protein
VFAQTRLFSRTQRSFLLTEQLIGAALFNLVLYALIGWLSFGPSPGALVSVWGDPGMAIDLCATSFVLPFVTSMIWSSLVRRTVRRASLLTLGWSPADHPALRWLPTSLLARSLVLALLSAVAVIPAILLTLQLVDAQHVSLLSFVLSKALLSAVLSAVVTPVAAVYVMAEETPALRVA